MFNDLRNNLRILYKNSPPALWVDFGKNFKPIFFDVSNPGSKSTSVLPSYGMLCPWSDVKINIVLSRSTCSKIFPNSWSIKETVLS